jgi:hypothetical protein
MVALRDAGQRWGLSGAGGRDRGSRWRDSRWWKLTGLCVGLNTLEMVLVAAFDHGARPDLAPQASAIAPFGVFGDLRWVSVYHDSWAAAASELAAMLVVRGSLTAVSIALAWPAHLPRPGAGTLWRRGLFATALAAVLLLPSVTLLFGSAVVPVSWLFLAAVPTALLVASIVHPAAVSADWWRRVAAARAVGWVALAFVTLSLASAAMDALPIAFWPVVAALGGLFNAWSWIGLVSAVVDRRPAAHMVPVGALATLVLTGTVVSGTVLGFNLARSAGASTVGIASPAPPRTSTGPAVLVVSGYGSMWEGEISHPIPGDFLEERFSYRGLGPQGEPLPYTSADTTKPIPTLDRMLLEQVAWLHARTGQRVAVVAESEGALVAKTALLADPSPAVVALVMASPLESPGRVWYPTAGDHGWGVASNEAMGLISDALQGVAPIDLSPDNPWLASLDRQAPVMDRAMSCPMAGVRQFALLPLADATVAPAPQMLPFPSVVLPAFHGGLLGTASGEQVVSQVLEHRPVDKDRWLALADQAISYAASAWQVPSLVPSEYPGAGHSPAGGSLSCRQAATKLRAALSALGPSHHRHAGAPMWAARTFSIAHRSN